MSADRLLEAIKTAAAGAEVAFSLHRPGSVNVTPAIIMTPGDPFLDTGTHGRIEERWDALVAFNPTAPDQNIDKMRELSLAVRAAAGSVGAVWEGASGPRRLESQETVLVSVNRLRFKHSPE